MFLEAGLKSNWINKSDFNAILKRAQESQEECEARHDIHALIFISALENGSKTNPRDISKLYSRVASRNQPGDSAINPDYLFLLEELYQDFFKKFEGPKIKLENTLQDTTEIISRIKNFLDTL